MKYQQSVLCAGIYIVQTKFVLSAEWRHFLFDAQNCLSAGKPAIAMDLFKIRTLLVSPLELKS